MGGTCLPPPSSLRQSRFGQPHARPLICLSTDDASPGTPLNVGSRVKAWVRVTAGPSTGVESEDAIGVRAEGTENAETGVVVYAADGLGRKLSSATVDGVVTENQQVKQVESDVLTPLVDQIVDQSKLALSVLMCYGDESSGRPDALFGGDGLLATTVDKILSHPNAPGGHGLQVGASLITMELLVSELPAEAHPA